MKILIITEGGNRRGLGHITRCLSLYHEFEKKKLKPCMIINDDSFARQYLRGRNVKVYKNSDDVLNYCKKASCVIVDSYDLKKEIYEKIKDSSDFLTCIDDNNRMTYPGDMLVNGSICAKDLKYDLSNGRTYFLGPEFMPLRPEFIKVREKSVIRSNIKNILITFGGNDPQDMTPKIRDFIAYKMPEARLVIIIGKAFCNTERFRINRNKNISYCYNLKASDMLENMLQSDVVVSAGGQTLYELARTGVPVIGICVASNQINNLKGWEKKGFLKFAGWHDDKDLFCNLGKHLDKLQDADTRRKMAFSGRRLVDGKGAERIVSRILEALK